MIMPVGQNGNKYRTVEELKNGTILAAGDAGLTFIRDGEITKVTGETDGLTVPKILCVLEQEDGTIFAGTDGNGIAVIKNGKSGRCLQQRGWIKLRGDPPYGEK